MNDRYEDPMQARTVGHDPADDLTQGPGVGEDAFDDPTHQTGSAHAPDEDRTQGREDGEAPYDDPTRGREVGSDIRLRPVRRERVGGAGVGRYKQLTSQPAKVLVAYYSATGDVHALAKMVAQGAREAGAEVRLRHVEELAPELLISQNQAWGRHRSDVAEEPTATLADLEWADGIAFGTPTRFGNVAAQLKMFLDQAGELWQQGKLINKVVTAFTSSQTMHGGQESTILALNNTFYHWGAIVVPLGYTVREAFNGGGNPYGASYTSGTRVGEPDPDTRAAGMAQGRRLARVARVIASAQLQGVLDVRCTVVGEAASRVRR